MTTTAREAARKDACKAIALAQEVIQKTANVLHPTAENLNLYSESKDSLGFFQQFARLGFVTEGSQEGSWERAEKGDYVALDALLMGEALEKEGEIEKKDETDQEWHDRVGRRYEMLGGKFRESSSGGEIKSSERAFVGGYMQPELADLFMHVFNKTQLIATCEDDGIPVTYSHCSNVRRMPTLLLPLGEVPCSTRISAHTQYSACKDMWREAFSEKPSIPFAHVTCIDPRHGHSAKNEEDGLYIEVLRALQTCHEMLGVK